MFLKIACTLPISQFEVKVRGIYAWRRIGLSDRWNFGELMVGEKIDGQFEGCGPFTFEEVKQN